MEIKQLLFQTSEVRPKSRLFRALSGFLLSAAVGATGTVVFYERFSGESTYSHIADSGILEAYSRLNDTKTGRELLSQLRGKHIPIKVIYGNGSGTIANYWNDQIEVSPDYAGRDVKYVAGVLAHEYTHAVQHLSKAPKSLDSEVAAFLNERLVWKELGYSTTNYCDYAMYLDLKTFDNGLEHLKRSVEKLYPELKWLSARERGSEKFSAYFNKFDVKCRAVWGETSEPSPNNTRTKKIVSVYSDNL